MEAKFLKFNEKLIFEDKLIDTCIFKIFEFQGLRYAMASMQGWRIDMEDAHVVEVG